jgi:hypothetical protein
MDISLWSSITPPGDYNWNSVTYGNGLFVAVASSSIKRVMSSTDGIIWTLRTPANYNNWRVVTYGTPNGQGLFVALADTGTEQIMTSPDGITWTGITPPVVQIWNSVIYGNGLFVAVGRKASSSTNELITSSDGIIWNLRTFQDYNNWRSVTYGNGLFVAVGSLGGNQVNISSDGIIWSSVTAGIDRPWNSVTYGTPNGVGIFVAVATGLGDKIMSSPDGIYWYPQNSAANNSWNSVTYGEKNGVGLFVAVASSGTGNRIMTSNNGITWNISTFFSNNNWNSVVYGISNGLGMFVTVAPSGSSNLVAVATTRSPTIRDFLIPTILFSDNTFILTDPISDSNGSFTYSSSDTEIATISGSTVTFIKVGSVTITATQAATTNFIYGKITSVLTINKGNPLISNFNNLIKIYGDAPFNLIDPTSTSPGLFTFSSSDVSIATISGSTVTILKTGTVDIIAEQAETYNYEKGTITCSFRINKATPILSNFNDLAKTYNDTVFNLINPTSSNLEGSLFTYSSSNTELATVSGSEVTFVKPGSVTITATQEATINYTSATITATLTVNKIQTILFDFDDFEKTYGDESFTLIAPTSSNTESNSFIYSSPSEIVDVNEEGYVRILNVGSAIIIATQEETDYYTSETIQLILKINKARPNLSDFADLTKTYNDTIFYLEPPSTFSSGQINYSSSNTEIATIIGDEVTIHKAGSVTIIATQDETDLYKSETITATLTINKGKPILSNFNNLTKIYGDEPFNLIAPTSSNTETNLFTYSSTITEIASIIGSEVTILGGGTIFIIATQEETENYLSESIICQLTIEKLETELSNFNDIVKNYDEIEFILEYPLSNRPGAIRFLSSDDTIAVIVENIVTIKSGGVVTITAIQDETYMYNSGIITCTLIINKVNPIFNCIDINLIDGVYQLKINTTSDGIFTYSFSDDSAVIINSNNTLSFTQSCDIIVTAEQKETARFYSGFFSIIVNHKDDTI